MDRDYTISKPVENPSFVVLSFGAGVQSTVMALMAAKGMFKPRPDFMIFADTGWEPKGVYDHKKWVVGEIIRLTNGQLPLIDVQKSSIRQDQINAKNSTGQRFASVPYFTENGGMGRRQCTNEYKIQPIIQEIRKIAGLKKGERAPKDLRVEQWIGISMDELERVAVNKKKYIKNRWPLLEIGFDRVACQKWFNEHYPDRKLTKSACIGCPYRNDRGWLDMKINDPESFKDAVYMDEIIRNTSSKGNMVEKQYMHSSCKPLSEVDFDPHKNQFTFGFVNECEGMCGL